MKSLNRRLTAVLCAGVVVLAASCGESTRPTTAAPSTASATTRTPSTKPTSATAPPLPDPTAQAKAGALATYQQVTAITTREFATNQEQPDLLTYVSGNAFMFFRQSLTWQISHYIVETGTPQSSPVVTGVKIDGTPKAYVTITDCYGGPGYKSVFVTDIDGYKKGQSAVVPGTSVAPHVVTAIVEDLDGTWMMINYTVSNKAC